MRVGFLVTHSLWKSVTFRIHVQHNFFGNQGVRGRTEKAHFKPRPGQEVSLQNQMEKKSVRTS